MRKAISIIGALAAGYGCMFLLYLGHTIAGCLLLVPMTMFCYEIHLIVSYEQSINSLIQADWERHYEEV